MGASASLIAAWEEGGGKGGWRRKKGRQLPDLLLKGKLSYHGQDKAGRVCKGDLLVFSSQARKEKSVEVEMWLPDEPAEIERSPWPTFDNARGLEARHTMRKGQSVRDQMYPCLDGKDRGEGEGRTLRTNDQSPAPF
jgi:hypothetical protein